MFGWYFMVWLWHNNFTIQSYAVRHLEFLWYFGVIHIRGHSCTFILAYLTYCFPRRHWINSINNWVSGSNCIHIFRFLDTYIAFQDGCTNLNFYQLYKFLRLPVSLNQCYLIFLCCGTCQNLHIFVWPDFKSILLSLCYSLNKAQYSDIFLISVWGKG